MSLSTMQWGHCDTHGEVLIHGSRCVCCYPAKVQEAKPVVRRRLKVKQGRPRSIELTPGERRIAEMAATGMQQIMIAKELGITRSAVESSLLRAQDRMGCKRIYELLRMVKSGGKADE